MYMAYGDKRILERHLPAMTKWVEWCRAHSTNLLRDHARGTDYGDWLAIGANTPHDVIGTAYFAYSTHLLAKSYAAVGDNASAAKYQALFENIRDAFDAAYVAPDGRIKGDTQCCYTMALRFELLPEALRANAAKYLHDDIAAKGWHLSTGFVGVSYLLPALSSMGDTETAYRLIEQDTFPSWLFSVKHGATTIWERWDGWTPDKGFQNPGMNSFNHYSLGSCGEWLYDTVAGIDWDESAPGYKHLILHPTPGPGLTNAKATLNTMYGPVTCGWRESGGNLMIDTIVPANSSATLRLPVGASANVTESGKALASADGVRLAGPVNGQIACEIGSGSYHFVITGYDVTH
jgi:alpha-L-rhamnosidase